MLGVNSEEKPIEDNCNIKSIAVIDAAAGTLTFPFSVEDVDRVGDFYYDTQLTDGAGKISTIRKGRMVFTQDITK